MEKKIWRFVPMCIGISLVGGFAVWCGFICYEHERSPVSVSRPHSYAVALNNVLELQALALGATRGEQAFFMSYVGCAASAVWQEPRVLDNLKSMVERGVEVKLIASSREQLPGADWPRQLATKLQERGLDSNIYALGELPNYSVVAGSSRRAVAYICSHEADNVYPTKFFKISDNQLCQEWRKYLLNEFVATR